MAGQRRETRRSSRATRVAAAPVPEAAPAASAAAELVGPIDLLKAGLKAIGEAHGSAVASHTRIFELLLGIGGARPGPLGLGLRDPLALRALDELFEQRLARVVERLSLAPPGREADAAALAERLRALEARVGRLEAQVARIARPQRPARG